MSFIASFFGGGSTDIQKDDMIDKSPVITKLADLSHDSPDINTNRKQQESNPVFKKQPVEVVEIADMTGVPTNDNHLCYDNDEENENEETPLLRQNRHFPKKPNHTKAKRTNVWKDKDGTSIFEKESSGTVGLTSESLKTEPISTKAITPQARHTANMYQFTKKNTGNKIQQSTDNDSDDITQEEKKVTKPVTLADFIKGDIPKSDTSGLSFDDLVMIATTYLNHCDTKTKELDKYTGQSIDQQIQTMIQTITDESQLEQLFNLHEQLEIELKIASK